MLDPTLALALQHIGLSEAVIQALNEMHNDLDMQRHLNYLLWSMHKGRVKNPPAWYTASLKNDWTAPTDMPTDWEPTVLTFRVDETTFGQFKKEMAEGK